MDKELKELFEKQGGVLKTSELLQHGYYYQIVQKLIAEGEVVQIRRGYYQWADGVCTEVSVIARLFPDGVICMESALNYYGYTKKVPSAWHIAVDGSSSRRRFSISYPIVKPHFVSPDKFGVGITGIEIAGTKFRIYDKERTICDCLRHRNQIDEEVYRDSIRSYLADPERDSAKLGKYAAELKVQKKVREVLGIWM